MLPDPALVPEDVIAVLRGLRAAGKQAWLAGGAVRDLVRRAAGLYVGDPPQDFDVATDALPEQVVKAFPKVVPTGIQHGTVTVLSGSHKVEVTTFRGEGPYLDGRRPSSVTFLGEIDGDLARRDFTVNAMAWDPIDRVLRDPFHGVGDLRRHLLRAVGDPLARFREDGLRPLRAVRFACTLRLAVDLPTRRAIPQAIDVFRKVALERVRDELVKLLVRGDPASRGLRLLLRTGLLAEVIPELLESVHFVQNRYHAWDVWRHTLRCVDFAPRELVVRLGALLHDVAKPRCAAAKEGGPGEHTFYDHEKVGAVLTAEILTRLRFPRREVERVSLLVREHNWHYQPEWNDATVRRTLARIGPAELPALWALRRADLQARGRLVRESLGNQAAAEERFERELDRPSALKISDLAIGGEDVMRELGLRPGPRVGEILTRLLERVMDDPDLNSRNTLIRLLAEVSQKLSTNNSQ
ncbi:MAG: HD domain-containing protein [Myxococcales bacterium]|nr:HD domain-containing protein [Myxococcales bacterium]